MHATSVRVEQGTLGGVRSGDGVVSSFKGVPFARPPVGARRWRPPQPPERWDGVRPADAFASHAIQPVHQDPLVGGKLGEPDGSYGKTSEDCLYLNVWTAAEDAEERRPVMVWFHHGAFAYGGPGVPVYDGENLARAGAVVVSVAYRLGRIGFMAHPELSAESEDGASSNYGLLDQIAALEWVQHNIAAFGGDPGCVTVFGVSAGSASVNLLMASPLARGLFHRAIGESAAMMGPAAPSTGLADLLQELGSAEQAGVALGRALGRNSIAELRDCPPADLIAVPPGKIQTQPPPVPSSWVRGGVTVPRGHLDLSYPVLDGHVLPRTPFETFSAGEQADIPLLTGSNANEAASLPYMVDLEAWIEDSRAEYGDHADRFLGLFDANADNLREVSGASRADRVFVAQAWAWARAHARSASAPTFYYHWSHVPPVRIAPEYEDKLRGAFHGVELPYVFGNLDVHDWAWAGADRSLTHVVSSYWLNFARTGDPNGEQLPEWSAFDAEKPTAMHFADEVGMGSVPRREFLEFWDDWYAAMRAQD